MTHHNYVPTSKVRYAFSLFCESIHVRVAQAADDVEAYDLRRSYKGWQVVKINANGGEHYVFGDKIRSSREMVDTLDFARAAVEQDAKRDVTVVLMWPNDEPEDTSVHVYWGTLSDDEAWERASEDQAAEETEARVMLLANEEDSEEEIDRITAEAVQGSWNFSVLTMEIKQ